ncbi:MAG: hypothetical protein IJK18_05945 [Clostridia bacterium]|nr:hypothetical protein [Clostridia bacterium]
MNKLVIEKGSFSVDDIHKVREYYHEMTKDMSVKERRSYYNKEAEKVRKEIRKCRKEKIAI